MDFAASDEHTALRQTLRRLLREASPSAEVRRVMVGPTGYDARLWKKLAALGITGIGIPEAYGGAGYATVELAIVLEEMGRALLPAPFLAGAVAARALLDSGDERAMRAHLPGIAAGETLATTTFTCLDDPPRALRDGGAYLVDGAAPYVLDGHIADVVLVAARADAGLSLFHLPGDGPGVSRTQLTTMDQTRRLARLEFAHAPATLVGAEGRAPTPDFAAAALAAEQVGGAAACLEMAVEYAKVRVQFGRPIGSFQAIKHRCADLLVDVESARSAAYHAAQVGEPVYAALAKAYCAEVYTRVAAENIQVHGGIGFTWEHDAHLHLKRAKSGEALFGSPAFHRARLGAAVGI